MAWILSQNKRSLVNANEIWISNNGNFHNLYTSTVTPGVEQECINVGCFKAEERALQELQTIVRWINYPDPEKPAVYEVGNDE